jgi:hypothetical protein
MKAMINVRNIVYHELLHAICGTEHDTECPLMEPELEYGPG